MRIQTKRGVFDSSAMKIEYESGRYVLKATEPLGGGMFAHQYHTTYIEKFETYEAAAKYFEELKERARR